MFADVIVDISVDALDRSFQYHIPETIEDKVTVGSRVEIPFGKGNRRLTGFVVGISDIPKWPVEKIKDLSNVDEKDLPVEGQLIALAEWIRNRYGATFNEALKSVLPVKKKINEVAEHWITLAIPKEQAVKAWEKYRLKSYKAKARLLEGLFNEGDSMTTKVALKKYSVNKKVVDSVVNDGIIQISDKRIYRDPIKSEATDDYTIELNDAQQKIADEFLDEYKKGIRNTYLIYGVTGSGKTEVYMEMIDGVLREGKQVIMLIPEISLTYQTVKRFQSRFGDRVSILNSRMSDGEKYDQYEKAKNGQVDIVVGPRSALFMPFSNLGLIIIDEEHELSYKSEKPPKYHTREVAIKRAELTNSSVVLGSATPSVESYQKAKDGNYKLFTLENRAKNASKPIVHVVDLREELREGNRSIFSRMLKEKINERLQKKEQIMLFLNRRGYAGFVSCRSCGFVLKCSHCDVSLTAHKNFSNKVDRLVCHYCGHTIKMPDVCPECGSSYIAAFGLGTQKVEDMINKEFPDARVLRMDGDTTATKEGHEAILAPFRRGEADILLGTQMIVKGHDIPNVTLVAALAADMSMYANDYLSNERTFDLLMQASGRAGRGEKAGEMIIQTYTPEKYPIVAVQNQAANIFYDNELAYRRMTSYPPYSNLFAVLVMSERETDAKECANDIAKNVKSQAVEGISVIGPTKAGLSKAKDRYRYVLYLKGRDESQVIFLKDIMEKISHSERWVKSCTVQFDFNPVNGY